MVKVHSMTRAVSTPSIFTENSPVADVVDSPVIAGSPGVRDSCVSVTLTSLTATGPDSPLSTMIPLMVTSCVAASEESFMANGTAIAEKNTASASATAIPFLIAP